MYGGTNGIHFQCGIAVRYSSIYGSQSQSPLHLQQRIACAKLDRVERDIEIINRNAERLNREAMDAFEYQRLP
jgi:hypothetical protein